jgi:hypothetical protein
MDGNNQTTRNTFAKSFCLTTLSFILTIRDEVVSQEVSIKFELTPDTTSAFNFHPILSGLLLKSAVLAFLIPFPGDSNEIASIKFVFPAPLLPNKATGPLST